MESKLINATATKTGLGVHVWNLDWTRITPIINKFLRLEIGNAVLYSVALTFVKLSIISTYYRIFPVPWVRKCLHVMTVITICTGIVTSFGQLFQCRPINAAWDISVDTRSCINIYTFVTTTNAIGIATDIAIYALPLPLVWRLTMTKPKRIAVSIIFSFGGL